MTIEKLNSIISNISECNYSYIKELKQNRFWLFRLLELDNNRTSSFRPNYFLDLLLMLLFIFKVPFFLLIGCKNIYVEHGRKYLIDDEVIDPFHAFIRNSDKGLKLIIFSSGHLEFITMHDILSRELKLPKTVLEVPRLIAYFFNMIFYNKNARNLKLLNNHLSDKCLVKSIHIRVIKTRAYNRLCAFLLMIFRVRTVHLADFYTANSSWCVAAKRLNKQVIEYQHGHITSEHYGYHRDNWIESECFPEKIVVYHKVWKQILSDLGWDDVVVLENSYMFNRAGPSKNNVITSNKILLITQPSIIEFQIEMLDELSNQMGIDNICVRLHPKLSTSIRRKLDGYKITTAYTSSLEDDVLDSDLVLGCFSTALIEASFFHKNVVSVFNSELKTKTNVFPSFGIKLIPVEKISHLILLLNDYD